MAISMRGGLVRHPNDGRNSMDWTSQSRLTQFGHELRTPLHAVLGFAQILRANMHAALHDRQRYVDHIEVAAQHIGMLVDDLTMLPQVVQGDVKIKLEVVRVRDVVDEAVAMVELSSKQAEVPIVVTDAVPLAMVVADRMRLRQVLLNLLTNAIKYSQRGRPIHLSLMRADAGARLRISVRDSGAGLRPDQLEHLFEPFNRLGAEHSGVEGLGIGLVIARGLMDMMGGDIEVVSEVDCGSTFAVVLPVAPIKP